MVGKNNELVRRQKNGNKFRRYSLKRLSIGVVPVAVASGFFLGSAALVSANENDSQPRSAVIVELDGLEDGITGEESIDPITPNEESVD